MAGTTWFMGDIHFGHANIVNFVDNDGARIRPFDDIDHHDEMLIKNFNDLVMPGDRVYCLGDLAFNRTQLAKVGRLNGRKKLLKGNHDILDMKDYAKYFEDVSSYRIYPKDGLIFSHIPVHPCQFDKRFKANPHGHLHANDILIEGTSLRDLRYLNLCPEKTEFKPVNYDQVIETLRKRGVM